MIVLFNKPYRVLSRFTATDERSTLADYIDIPGVYCAGLLDYDSEGLLVLTDDGRLQQRIADPRFGKRKGYLVQVEGVPDEHALDVLRHGVQLRDGLTLPARVRRIEPPELWPREPPIRVRKSIPDSWLELEIGEGRNRQVRRMCAAIGYPVLRLVRHRVGDWTLDGLQPGRYRVLQHEPPQPTRRRRRGPAFR